MKVWNFRQFWAIYIEINFCLYFCLSSLGSPSFHSTSLSLTCILFISLVDFSVKMLHWSDREKVRLQLWDIAGKTFSSPCMYACMDGWLDDIVNFMSSLQARSVSYPWPGSIIKVRWAVLWCLTSPAHPASLAVAIGNRTLTTRQCCPTETPSPASCWPTRWFSAFK